MLSATSYLSGQTGCTPTVIKSVAEVRAELARENQRGSHTLRELGLVWRRNRGNFWRLGWWMRALGWWMRAISHVAN